MQITVLPLEPLCSVISLEVKVKVKESHYRLERDLRVPGG